MATPESFEVDVETAIQRIRDLETALNRLESLKQDKEELIEDMTAREDAMNVHSDEDLSRRDRSNSLDSNDRDANYFEGETERGEMDALAETISAEQESVSKLSDDIAEKTTEVNMEVIETVIPLVKEISEMRVQGNVWNERFGTTPARVWEYFGTALLPYCSLFENDPVGAEHCGGVNDKGADILLHHPTIREERKAVVQVKRGKQFERGEGNTIVLCLIGTCVYYCVRTGIIFSNEQPSNLSQNTDELIQAYRNLRYEIRCYFKEEIYSLFKNLDTNTKVDVLVKLQELLRSNRARTSRRL